MQWNMLTGAGLLLADSSLADAAAPMAENLLSGNGLWGLFVKGGFFMWPILACSIVMLAVALERLVSLRPGAVRPARLARDVDRQVRSADTTAVLQVCARKPGTAYARLVRACMLRAGSGNDAMETALEESGARVLYDLRRGSRPLGVIADIAPLLGLLGTVTGMIKAFNVVASAGGLGKAELLAEGIGEALLTTAFGLCVAVPAIILYHYFQGRAEGWVRVIEDDCLSYAHALHGPDGTPAP